MEISAPAKINLFLQVTGRRPDGYHELRSVFLKLDLADRIEVRRGRGRGIRLRCPNSGLPTDEGNLVHRAATAYLTATGRDEAAIEIVLHKNIPVAAGLGGGSSDAAAVLVALDRLFATRLSRERLLSLARPLGADVPFFVQPHAAALVTGIGHDMEPFFKVPPCFVVLANPGISVSTKWVYENLALTSQAKPFTLGCSHSSGAGGDGPLAGVLAAAGTETLTNDLEKVTAARYPVIGSIEDTMRSHGAMAALMSGSGPTVFGLFADKAAAERCCQRLEQDFDAVFLTRPVLPDGPLSTGN